MTPVENIEKVTRTMAMKNMLWLIFEAIIKSGLWKGDPEKQIFVRNQSSRSCMQTPCPENGDPKQEEYVKGVDLPIPYLQQRGPSATNIS